MIFLNKRNSFLLSPISSVAINKHFLSLQLALIYNTETLQLRISEVPSSCNIELAFQMAVGEATILCEFMVLLCKWYDIWFFFLFLGIVAWKWLNKCTTYTFLNQKNIAPQHLPMPPNACTGTCLRNWRGVTLHLTRPILETGLIGWVSESHQW